MHHVYYNYIYLLHFKDARFLNKTFLLNHENFSLLNYKNQLSLKFSPKSHRPIPISDEKWTVHVESTKISNSMVCLLCQRLKVNFDLQRKTIRYVFIFWWHWKQYRELNLRGCQADLSCTCMHEQGSSNYALKMIYRKQNP